LAAQSQELEDLLLLQLHFVRLRVARPREGIKNQVKPKNHQKRVKLLFHPLRKGIVKPKNSAV